MTEQNQAMEGWVIVELFGHKKLAGLLSSQEIPGGVLPRIDVPATEPRPDEGPAARPTPAYTRLLGLASIYGIQPVDEAVARLAAREIERWSSPLPLALPAPQVPRDEDEEYDDDEDRLDNGS